MKVLAISQFLDRLGLAEYSSTFETNHIDFETLKELDDSHLESRTFYTFCLSIFFFKEMGIHSMGHRIKLLKAIEEFKSVDSPVVARESVEYPCKIIVVGDVGKFLLNCVFIVTLIEITATGKTSLIQRYTVGTFDGNYKATVNICTENITNYLDWCRFLCQRITMESKHSN
ncbi:MAG: hypothetical protein JST59_02290 [Actinobacteria bacterium]|nr:hypothetical protein [Actinomycetota bacterium]